MVFRVVFLSLLKAFNDFFYYSLSLYTMLYIIWLLFQFAELGGGFHVCYMYSIDEPIENGELSVRCSAFQFHHKSAYIYVHSVGFHHSTTSGKLQ
jgi:hypothetical protein